MATRSCPRCGACWSAAWAAARPRRPLPLLFEPRRDQRLNVPASTLIRCAMVVEKPDPTLEDLLACEESLVQMQGLQIAVNAGTTRPPLEAALIEMYQNSMDAVAAGRAADCEIDVQAYPDGDGHAWVGMEDRGTGIPDILTLLIPYYSTKDAATSVGQMGNGFFNVYRDADRVYIRNCHGGGKPTPAGRVHQGRQGA